MRILLMSRKNAYIGAMIFLLIIVFIYMNNPSLASKKINFSTSTGEPSHLEVISSSAVNTHVTKSKYSDINLVDLRERVKTGDKEALQEFIVRMHIQSRESNADVYSKYSGTKSQDSELWAWREARGYWRPTGDAQYGSYNHEALASLMNTGDVRALEEMALRMLNQDYIKANGIDIISAMKIRDDIVYKAAVYGSTKSLETLGGDIHSISRAKGSPEMKSAKIDEFAWYTVAAKRGDLMPLHSSVASLSNLYDISFTESDWRQISEKADLLYRDLEQKRIDLGLGAFDNSVPGTVQNFFDTLYPKPKELPNFMP